MRIEIPADVRMILQVLTKAGYEAFTVGGCTRDSILGRVPKDWDITTSAMPEQVKGLFHRTIDTGIKHGTVTVMIGREGYEVTTYRIDGEYKDGRHPEKVVFTRSLKEDLQRRDFTINAMAYNPQEGLVDLFEGTEDIRRRRIRCVGDPRARFEEDALRMMRAVRFAAQLDFSIEENTAQAIRELSVTMARISAERVRMELEKLLLSPHPERIETARKLGITAVVLPEFDALFAHSSEEAAYPDAGNHTIAILQEAEEDKVIRFSALMIYLDPSAADRVMKRLKFDNQTRNRVVSLIRFHAFSFDNTERDMRRFLYESGKDLFPDLARLRRAQISAGSPADAGRAEQDLLCKEELYRKVIREKQCCSLDGLAVNGSDLIQAGVKPGKKMGELLHALLNEVIDDESLNHKEILIRRALEITRED